ncbi:hypothetical protein E4U24_002415 [Claviceps purpurea]|nr:hypothetical protein E4U24_002415 [Claviceps purpurea]
MRQTTTFSSGNQCNLSAPTSDHEASLVNMNFFFSNSHHSTWLRDHSDQPVKQFHNQLHHPQRHHQS